MLPSRRTAFSLVELLVVIAILAVLAGLTMSGVSYVRVRQQTRTTEQIVFKLQEAVDQLVKATVEQVRKERLSRSSVFTSLLPYCDNDEDRAEALLLYCRLRHNFPQSFDEARSGLVIYSINWPPHTAYNDLPAGNAPPGFEALEAAVLLRKAVSRLGIGGANFASDDLMGTAQAELPWPHGGTAPVFIDAWPPHNTAGNPRAITFRRFFTGHPDDHPDDHGELHKELQNPPFVNPNSDFHDPFDPLGKLADPHWSRHSDAQNRLGVSFNRRNRVITVQSAGPDREYNTADDIWGYRLRQIGARGQRQ
jgi:prepilin-type N-terminal cleavage/methylation domain-containing protein